MIYTLDLLGVVVFAISGALVGLRKELDLFGIMVVSVVTAIGGGTLRDLLLDSGPVFWVDDPVYVVVAGLSGLATVLISGRIEAKMRYLLWADALGLAFYGILGVRAADAAGVPAVTAVLLACMGAVAGGAVRDVLCAQTPFVLREEIYATAVMSGAGVYLLLMQMGLGQVIAFSLGFSVCLGLRLLGMSRKWSLSVGLLTRTSS